MQETDHHNRHQTSMFESLLHKIQMDLTGNQFMHDPDQLHIDALSPRSNSLKSNKSSPKKWAFDQQQSFQPVIQQMIDFLSLEQNRQLQRIQTSRMDQQSKIGVFLSHHRIKIRQEDTSRQKQLKDNLNLSPRKKKRIDKQKIKIPKFKLQ